jgi:hypothetical protein
MLDPPAGFGVDWTVQVVPFQYSARVSPDVPSEPTASHDVELVQATELRVPGVVEAVVFASAA